MSDGLELIECIRDFKKGMRKMYPAIEADSGIFEKNFVADESIPFFLVFDAKDKTAFSKIFQEHNEMFLSMGYRPTTQFRRRTVAYSLGGELRIKIEITNKDIALSNFRKLYKKVKLLGLVNGKIKLIYNVEGIHKVGVDNILERML